MGFYYQQRINDLSGKGEPQYINSYFYDLDDNVSWFAKSNSSFNLNILAPVCWIFQICIAIVVFAIVAIFYLVLFIMRPMTRCWRNILSTMFVDIINCGKWLYYKCKGRNGDLYKVQLIILRLIKTRIIKIFLNNKEVMLSMTSFFYVKICF